MGITSEIYLFKLENCAFKLIVQGFDDNVIPTTTDLITIENLLIDIVFISNVFLENIFGIVFPYFFNFF